MKLASLVTCSRMYLDFERSWNTRWWLKYRKLFVATSSSFCSNEELTDEIPFSKVIHHINKSGENQTSFHLFSKAQHLEYYECSKMLLSLRRLPSKSRSSLMHMCIFASFLKDLGLFWALENVREKSKKSCSNVVNLFKKVVSQEL